MKKWIIILIAVIAVLVVAGIVAAIMLSRDGNDNNGSSNNENEPDTATIGTVQVFGNDYKTKVIVTAPPELEVTLEKSTVGEFGIEIAGKVTNVSSQTVTADVDLFLDGLLAYGNNPQRLGPGEVGQFNGYISNAEAWGKKVLEIRAVIQKPATIVPPATTPPPTTAPPTTTQPAETPETQVFTSAPRNPETPEEVAVAFVFALAEGNYAKLRELASSTYLRSFPSKEQFEKEINSNEGKEFMQNFKSVEITEKIIEGNIANLDGIFYFKRPTPTYPDATDPSVTFRLVKENGKWKVAE